MNKRIISLLLCILLIAGMLPRAAQALTTITDVELFGLVKPEDGQHPASMTISSDAPYTLYRTIWWNATDDVEVASTDTFKGGVQYYARAVLQAKSGYAFPDDASELSSVTIDGTDSLVDSCYYNKGTGRFSVYTTTFLTPGGTVISDVDVLGFVKPAGGAHPAEMTAAEDAPYEISIFYWYDAANAYKMDASDTFTTGGSYYAYIELTPKIGYIFPKDYAELASVTFDGDPAEMGGPLCSIRSDGTLVLYSRIQTAVEPSVITEIALTGLAEPVEGAHPAEMTAAEDAPYEIYSFYWYDVTDAYAMDALDAFKAGNQYYAYIELAPKSGYTFPNAYSDLTDVTFDGSASEVDGDQCWIRSDGILVLFSRPQTAAELITSVEIGNFMRPVIGLEPPVPSVADDAPYDIDTYFWWNVTSNYAMTSGTFEESMTYYLEIVLTPKSGYTFPETFADLDSVTLSGSDEYLDNVTSAIHANTLTLDTFWMASGDPIEIDQVNIDLILPVAGEHPVGMSVAADAPYVLTGYAWVKLEDGVEVDPSDTFEAGTEYYAYAELEPKSGYTFPSHIEDLSEVAFDGRSEYVDTYNYEPGLRVYTVAFTADPPETITEVALTGLTWPVVGALPELPAAVADAPFTIINVYWTNETDGYEMTTGVFEAGKDYYATVTLSPKYGYVFPASFGELAGVTFDGSSRYVDTDNSDIDAGDLAVRSRTFTASDMPVITAVEISGFEEPKYGAHPSTLTVASDAPYTIDYYWYDELNDKHLTDSDVFEEGTYYWADILIVPKSGYTLPADIGDLSGATFDGSTEFVDLANSKIEFGWLWLVSETFTVAVEPAIKTVSRGEDTVNYTLEGTPPAGSALIAAAYDANGRFIGCAVQADPDETPVPLEAPADADVRAFLVDADDRPLCEPVDAP